MVFRLFFKLTEKLQNCNLNMEGKLAKSFILLVACWTIAWTPFAFVSLIGCAGYGHFISVRFVLSF